ncbi:MAG: branched-chain amino acid ABC transporter permease [Deltaproteobacteria bacterium]|nr:MAG: branched-chain amino acid ABC transporter permease [Deltaproteobacteria bacterium]
MSNKGDIKRYSKSPYMKVSYPQDMVISAFDTPFRRKWAVVGIVFFLALPFIVTPFFVHIANLIMIACIGAMALNLVTGVAGLLSLGHAGFMCAGAFTVAICASRWGMPIWFSIPAAGVVGAFLGLLAGLPSFRLKGLYLGISTLAMHFIILYVAREYQFYAGYGHSIKVVDPSIGPFVISGGKNWYFVLAGFVWLTALFITNLLRSRPGRAWIAIRDRDISARAMGINIGRYKVLAFMVGTAITSIEGGLYAYYTNMVSADEYTFYLTVSYIAMIIVGGVGSVLGSIMGAVLITLIPHLLMYLFGLIDVPIVIKEYFFAIESGVFGLIIIFFILVEPLGLIEIWRRIRVFFELWPFKYRPLMITKR